MSSLVGVFAEIALAYDEEWSTDLASSAEGEDIVERLEYMRLDEYQHIDTSSTEELGEDCYTIFKWKDKYYRVDYQYQSHYGIKYYGDGSNVYEVFPKTVEVIQYV